MNQARIWLVVNPTLGLPLFLGAVATISLIVHASVLSHSSWFPAFLEGGGGKAAAVAAAPAAAPAPVAMAAPAPAAAAPAAAEPAK